VCGVCGVYMVCVCGVCVCVCVFYILFIGTALKPGIIFRGKGQISKEEKLQYDPSVDIYWQKSAWADRSVCEQWIDRTFSPVLGTYLQKTYTLTHKLYFLTIIVFR